MAQCIRCGGYKCVPHGPIKTEFFCPKCRIVFSTIDDGDAAINPARRMMREEDREERRRERQRERGLARRRPFGRRIP